MTLGDVMARLVNSPSPVPGFVFGRGWGGLWLVQAPDRILGSIFETCSLALRLSMQIVLHSPLEAGRIRKIP